MCYKTGQFYLLLTRILLLDEGTAHLDDTLQRQVLGNLAGLGMTMIAVTHDPRVLECADRCVRI